jgi:hypothetical protein
MNNLMLFILILFHWFIMIVSSFYIFFRKSPKYDTLYFIITCSIIISWTLTQDECLISYWERLCIQHDYVFNSQPSVPFIDLIFKEASIIVSVLLFVCQVYTMYSMLRVYNVPPIIILTFLYYMVYFIIIKDRIEEFHNTSNNKQ